jgi:PPM family protein phosphatase
VTWPFHFDTNLTEEENRLVTGIRVANRQILDRSERSRECQGMGTTVVGAMYSPSKNRVFIGHVGDSRCYRVRDGEIKLLTRDHSLVNDYITAMPDLTDEQKAELPKNVITRALGMQKDVIVDLQSDEPRAGDVYVLCSDGLNGMLRDEEILGAVRTHGVDISASARKLIDQANANGGEDNITVVLIHVEEDRGASPFATTATSAGVTIADDDTVASVTPPVGASTSPSGEKPEA